MRERKLGVCWLCDFPEIVFDDQFVPVLSGVICEMVIVRVVGGVMFMLHKVEVACHDGVAVGRDVKYVFQMDGPSFVVFNASGEIDIDDAEGHGGGGVAFSDASEFNRLCLTLNFVVEVVCVVCVVVVDDGAGGDYGAGFVVFG